MSINNIFKDTMTTLDPIITRNYQINVLEYINSTVATFINYTDFLYKMALMDIYLLVHDTCGIVCVSHVLEDLYKYIESADPYRVCSYQALYFPVKHYSKYIVCKLLNIFDDTNADIVKVISNSDQINIVLEDKNGNCMADCRHVDSLDKKELSAYRSECFFMYKKYLKDVYVSEFGMYMQILELFDKN